MSFVVKIRELPTPETKLISEVISVCKLILVNPATSASVERSFSTAQRLKTWFRSKMTRAIYHLDKHTKSLVDLANEFSDRSDNRRGNFGIFRESDIQ